MLNIFIQNHFDSILDLSVIFNSVGFMNDSGSAHFFSGADNCSFFMNGKFFPSLLHVVIQASCLLFFAGLWGVAKNRKNFIILMVFVEIMFLGIILIFIYTAHFFSLPEGQVYALINLGISAAEAAIGFGLFIASFRHFSFAVFEGFNKLKG